jgi:hypothetical protein
LSDFFNFFRKSLANKKNTRIFAHRK